MTLRWRQGPSSRDLFRPQASPPDVPQGSSGKSLDGNPNEQNEGTPHIPDASHDWQHFPGCHKAFVALQQFAGLITVRCLCVMSR
jgi:hypothetical protein